MNLSSSDLKYMLSADHTTKSASSLDPALIAQLKQQIFNMVGCCIIVHQILGPFLNEYMYQDALAIEMAEKNLTFEKEFYFSVDYKGTMVRHKHYVDFMVQEDGKSMLLECKAVDRLGDNQRQQLWNYMRLTGTQIGVLFNFSPVKAQCERYYLNPATRLIKAF